MSFDSLAPHYRWLENVAFGNALQKARTFFLDQIPAPQHVLIAGEGNGKFLRAFARKFPEADIDCVDASARMLLLAREQIQREQSLIRFRQEDLLTWSPDESAYDLIVTHFFLDCFNESEVETIVDKLARSARQNALWLLADFFIPEVPLMQLHAQLWLRSMYWFFRATTEITAQELINPRESLRTQGFRLVSCNSWRFGLIRSELWERRSR